MSSSYRFISPSYFPADFLKVCTDHLHLTSPLPTPHWSRLYPSESQQPQQMAPSPVNNLCIVKEVINFLLPFSGCQQHSMWLITLQLEVSALSFCDTMFFWPSPDSFWWVGGELGWAPPTLLSLPELEFYSTQNLALSFHSALNSSWYFQLSL